MTAVDLIDAEVREIVRQQGLDPAAEPAAVRQIVDQVITAYDERSLSVALPSLGDAGAAARHVLDAVSGLGPLQRYLDDPSVEEVLINSPPTVTSRF